MLSIIIFIVSFAHVGFVAEYLMEITTALNIMHALGFVLGLGGAIAGAFLFSKFLGDRAIDDEELKVLQEMSELVWLGLAFTILSQLASYVVYTDTLAASGPFLMQTLALFVAVVANAALMIIFAPFLAFIPFKETAHKESSSLLSLRRPAFVSGALALSSWFFAFLMDYTPSYTFGILLLMYGAFLAVAVVIVLVWERRVANGPRS